MGHAEYDRDTLRKEYLRDVAAGVDIQIPRHYFPVLGQGPLGDAVMVVQPRLGTPADVEGGVDVGFAPLHDGAHAEYDRDTLRREYLRDVAAGVDIQIPRHYFPEDDPGREPLVRWRSCAHLLYANWLNYCVYQKGAGQQRGGFAPVQHTRRRGAGEGDSRTLQPEAVPGPCAALDAQRRLGLTVTDSLLLNPVKSVTAVIGLSPTPQPARIRGCGYCNFRENCQFRKEGTTCGR